MSTTRSRLTQCFKAVFPKLSDEQIYAAQHSSVPDWDSLSAISLITVVEEEFNIQIQPEEMGDLDSFEKVLDYLEHEQAPVAG